MPRPVITLVGATATGKSSLAIEVARALAKDGIPAEIVNADSMLAACGQKGTVLFVSMRGEAIC